MCHTFRFPSRHDGAVGVSGNGGKHFFRVDRIYGFLGVGRNCGTVRTLSGQFGSGPVKYRHEIVAYQMDVFLAQIFQSFDIMIDVKIPIGGSCFDGIMYIDTFDSGDMKSCGGYFRFQCGDPFAAPYFSPGAVSYRVVMTPVTPGICLIWDRVTVSNWDPYIYIQDRDAYT